MDAERRRTVRGVSGITHINRIDGSTFMSTELDRRAFVAYFSSVGLGSTLLPGVLWGQTQQEPGRVTKEMIADAEKIAGLTFTEAQRDRLVNGVNSLSNRIDALRKVELPNSVPPALRFDPVLPGMTIPTTRKPMRRSKAAPVRRPANLEDVAFWPVTDLSELIRTRQVKPSELTEMYIARLHRHGPTLEAVVTYTDERARAQAARADAEIAAGKYRGPLHGIPWGAKDLFSVKGYRTTWGAEPYKDQVIDDDAAVVQKLDAAGAILIAKLTLGALAQGDIWYGGRTRNPWNTTQGSSGSSAGPGAATAAGLVGFAIGTETLGSIMSPSARNGVTGLRPTFGRVSRAGAMALSWSMDKIGPMCRSVEDCALVFDAIHGPDGRDNTVRDVPFSWDAALSLKSLRVGYLQTAFDQKDRNGAVIQYNVDALEAMRRIVPGIKPIATPHQIDLGPLGIILDAESAAAFDDLTRSGRADVMEAPNPYPSTWPGSFRAARFIPAVEYIQANRVRTLVMQNMHDVMKDVDVFMTTSNGDNVLQLTNLTGHPAIALPAGFNAMGSPVSITFVGGLYQEDKLLAVAKAWQDATGFHLKHPPKFI
jgi:Asp-tRNA(Asn)/Glu-tRNA(Gln) amidotransferase A subunit family amidase